ncbi:PDDEXK nuclease domain-containing protein [Roseibacillus persicicus]|uniref:PDDEXK nuclease domain-containing protein n=1 Tax=Roseibacillus persicicus TaxID=454148 RepID=UPI00398B1457
MSHELTPSEQSDFSKIATLVSERRRRALQAVNHELVSLYWEVGRILSKKIETNGWGKKTIEQLAAYLKESQPGLRGFTRPNLYRMRQFFEVYPDLEIVSALPRQLSWTHHLLIISQCKSPEERNFYLNMVEKEDWSSRELERQLKGSLFERVALSSPNISPVVNQLHPSAESIFKDSYLVEFLDLPAAHSENELHQGLIQNLREFLTELGRDFCFIGSKHPIQVGNQDFALDLLFFHRELNCLVAIELKVGRFEPEHLGKLNFYLEALDRDIKKEHENPSIGLLLCASKDDEVVEYALSRSLSPALIAHYETKLPDKKLLQAKLHEFLELSQLDEER